MKVGSVLGKILECGITTVVGVPDSTLKHFSAGVSHDERFSHYVCPNEGAAVGMATGAYLSTGKPSCVYMQNSGVGNSVNPITSLANQAVYGIPMLFVIGWRGEPSTKDEPQHKFMGKITPDILTLLEIEYSFIGPGTTQDDLDKTFDRVTICLHDNKQYAIVIKPGALESVVSLDYVNNYSFVREDAIKTILEHCQKDDLIVSTTGKISREVYEQNVLVQGLGGQAFLTVGGMGHASMISLGAAVNLPDNQVYCLDGDGAVLMHMGGLSFIAKQAPKNLTHICLNNEAHESVGGMPTCAAGADFSAIAKACGYPYVFRVWTKEELHKALTVSQKAKELCFIEILVTIFSRPNLGRPRESAAENKTNFMKYHGVIK